MKSIWTIFLKEAKDTLRDRRTIIMMVGIPLLLIPILMIAMTKIGESQAEKELELKLTVALVHGNLAPGLAEVIASQNSIELVSVVSEDSAKAQISRDDLDAVFVVSPDFDSKIALNAPGVITMIHNTGDITSQAVRRMRAIPGQYEASLLAERYEKLEIDPSINKAVDLVENNLASQRKLHR